MKKIILFILLLGNLPLSAMNIGNLHRYRAQLFAGEPFLAEERLGRLDIQVGAGSTTHARTQNGQKTDILVADGTHAYTGTFHITEATFSYSQNFSHGLFAGVFVPFRSIKITNGCRIDCRSKQKTPVQSFKKRGSGDVTLYAGWTINYQETCVLDYIDATFKLGALIPSAPKKDPVNPLSIPLGYNGHPGVTFVADSSFGIYDWLTVGAHAETILFFAKKQNERKARIHKGPAWQVGIYARADHLVRGLSGLIGYSYTQQQKESLYVHSAAPLAIFPVNSLCTGWSMHTLHTGIEYDFTKENMKYGPRVGAFYDIQMSGKNTFNANLGGGTFGLDIACCY